MSVDIDLVLEQIKSKISSQHIVVAYSGGLDSHVLLHALAQLRDSDGLVVRAVHVDHGLSPNSTQWAVHCQKICEALTIPLRVKQVSIDLQKGESLEACAREARYAVFKDQVENDEDLLTAHTKDDQAETLLLQLMRGAGVKGLSAMPVEKPFASGMHVRPFLSLTRADLEAYAQKNQLEWIEDESNQDARFDRNFLRHQVLPALNARWPSLLETVTRSSQHCAEAAGLLDELAAMDYEILQTGIPEKIKLKPLQLLSVARQRNVLRYWFHRLKLPLPSQRKLGTMLTDVLQCRHDATPEVAWAEVALRRYREYLYCLPQQSAFDSTQTLTWTVSKDLVLPENLGILECGGAIDAQTVVVRFRQGGESIKLKGRDGTRDLKTCMQEWGVPPWERDRIPLIYVGDDLVVVVGYGAAEGYEGFIRK